MERSLWLLLIVMMLAGTVTGCVRVSVELQAASEAETAEAAEDEAAEDTAAEVVYDARSQTLSVEGARDYAKLAFPEETGKARVLQVKDDAFVLSVYLPVLREVGIDVQPELPEIIDRTARSLSFLKEYLYENAGSAYPDMLIEKPVFFKIDRYAFSYQIDDEQITVRYDDAGMHREFLYLLALQNGGAIGWEQIGYAWYVGTCIDPYSEMASRDQVLAPELPYYTQCIDAGVDPDNMTAADFRTLYDACASVSFRKGLNHWGSYCESAPVTSEGVFTRQSAKEPGDTSLSAFMAASFLAWLDDAYGFEQVSMFCFGYCSFEEAFGKDFQSAFDEWHAWIEETYP